MQVHGDLQGQQRFGFPTVPGNGVIAETGLSIDSSGSEIRPSRWTGRPGWARHGRFRGAHVLYGCFYSGNGFVRIYFFWCLEYIDGVVLLKRPMVIHVSIVPCMRAQAIMLLCVHDLDHLDPVCDSTWLESLLSLTASRRQEGNIPLLLEGP